MNWHNACDVRGHVLSQNIIFLTYLYIIRNLIRFAYLMFNTLSSLY